MYVKKYVSPRIVFKFAWKYILFFAVLSSLVCYLYYVKGFRSLALPLVPIGTLGTAIAILLGFRNNSAYDRFWEARKIWGGVVNYSRTFARQITTLTTLREAKGMVSPEELKAFQKEMVYRHLAWVNGLRLHLRKEDLTNPSCWWELADFLPPGELRKINKAKNKPTQLVQNQGIRLNDAFEMGLIDNFRHMQLDSTLTELYNLQGRCERIKNTPLPRQYAFFTFLFTWIFMLLVPFSFVKDLGWMSIPLTVLITWIFQTVESVGHYTENPFDNVINDVPMTALSRTIEIDLREQIGETELPPALKPVRGVLM